MKRKDTARILAQRIDGLKRLEQLLTYQRSLLEDLYEDLVLGPKDG